MEKHLIEKYNTPVPRYTSYPPANYFNDKITSDIFLDAVEESNSWEPESVSLYFHIPFCRKMCHYCGCNSCLLADNGIVDNYFKALKKELTLISNLIDKKRKVSQIHFGGGTPNSVPSTYLTEVAEHVSELFSFTSEPEIAIECNPAYLDKSYIKNLTDSLFNRFSFGIQDLNSRVLNNINRDTSKIPLKELALFIRSQKAGVKINFDFIYGLPGQSVESFAETIEKAVEIAPDRLVTFSYAHVPWVNPSQKILERIGLPQNQEKAAIYRRAKDLLVKNGYLEIGIDHFVLKEDELFKALKSGRLHRNFQGYCTRETTGQVYAFGASAISQLQGIYAQNTKSVDNYIKALSSDLIPVEKGYRLNSSEITIREVITTFMCNGRVEWSALADYLDLDPGEIKRRINYNIEKLEEFKKDGLIDFTDEHIKVTDTGSMFMRNIAASFDPIINDGSKRFSKSF